MIILSALLIVTVIIVVYYWVDFYAREGVQVTTEDWYIKFQRSFPPADLWMAACALTGAIGLLTHQNYGLLFSLLAASSMIFLALMDITFNIQNDLYRLVGELSQMKLELLGNLWFLGMGIAVIVCLWSKIALL